jgi:hypothetical protein
VDLERSKYAVIAVEITPTVGSELKNSFLPQTMPIWMKERFNDHTNSGEPENDAYSQVSVAAIRCQGRVET